ncbi:hypothetical protein KIPB_011811, partial [Kipferlia bialata]
TQDQEAMNYPEMQKYIREYMACAKKDSKDSKGASQTPPTILVRGKSTPFIPRIASASNLKWSVVDRYVRAISATPSGACLPLWHRVAWAVQVLQGLHPSLIVPPVLEGHHLSHGMEVVTSRSLYNQAIDRVHEGDI